MLTTNQSSTSMKISSEARIISSVRPVFLPLFGNTAPQWFGMVRSFRNRDAWHMRATLFPATVGLPTSLPRPYSNYDRDRLPQFFTPERARGSDAPRTHRQPSRQRVAAVVGSRVVGLSGVELASIRRGVERSAAPLAASASATAFFTPEGMQGSRANTKRESTHPVRSRGSSKS